MTEFNQREKQAVILGALLHDVGKFVQRASINPRSQDHSHWGEDWFQNNLAEKLTPVFNESEKQIIRSAISNHHFSEKYISLADAISAGMDRIELEAEEKGDPFTDRLISIFSRISISDAFKKDMCHELIPLGKNHLKETFPIDDKKCSYKEYSKLLHAFEQEIRSMDFSSLSPWSLIDCLYFLLWKYSWCIPSSAYKDEPDVSLFDHLKTTAAIAACLFAFQRDNPEKSLDLESRAFYLIGGDISGIQTYIFEVLSQQGKVAKRLRARSLFVQLISEIASHKILHTFELTLCNLIISAGGNFYILVPSLKDTTKRIEKLQKEFDKWTINQLNAELSISLASKEVSGKDLTDFSNVIDSLKTELNYKKHQPHKLMLSLANKWVIEEFLRPEVIEGDDKACNGCRKNPRSEIEKNEDNLCSRCINDIKIGQTLNKSKYIAFYDDETHEFKIFNYSFELWDEDDLRKTSKNKPYLVIRLNNPEIEIPVIGFKYLVTHIPSKNDIPQAITEDNYPVTFDDIANVSQGDKLLGYVKGDVDNLGQILREGFKTKLSISRFTTFSRMLETFFAGFLHIKLSSEFKETYSVFSGGDDFFVIGPWNKTIEFAHLVRKEFSYFCADNPDLKFSAGISLFKPHEPLSFCAETVEAKLKDSKRHEGKDKITLFSQTVRWDELEKILIEAKRVINWLEKKPSVISRGFAYNLREYGYMADKSGIYKIEGDIQTKYLKFIPLLVYDINRNLAKKEQKDAYFWALDLRPTTDKFQGGDNLPYLKTIMEYVLTYTRS